MQASLYRFKSSIVNSAHTATTAIMNALQHTAVDDDEFDFNENMFPCCEENEVNSPGKINLSNFNCLEVLLTRFLFKFFDLLYLMKLRLNCKWIIQFIYSCLFSSFCSLPSSLPSFLPSFLPPSLLYFLYFLYFLHSFLLYYNTLPTFSPLLSITSTLSLILYYILPYLTEGIRDVHRDMIESICYTFNLSAERASKGVETASPTPVGKLSFVIMYDVILSLFVDMPCL